CRLLHQHGQIADGTTRTAGLLRDRDPEYPEIGEARPVFAPEIRPTGTHCCNWAHRCRPPAHGLLDGFMLVSGDYGHTTYRLSGVTSTPRTCSNVRAGRKSSAAQSRYELVAGMNRTIRAGKDF